jgi:hypothetical protein
VSLPSIAHPEPSCSLLAVLTHPFVCLLGILGLESHQSLPWVGVDLDWKPRFIPDAKAGFNGLAQYQLTINKQISAIFYHIRSQQALLVQTTGSNRAWSSSGGAHPTPPP